MVRCTAGSISNNQEVVIPGIVDWLAVVVGEVEFEFVFARVGCRGAVMMLTLSQNASSSHSIIYYMPYIAMAAIAIPCHRYSVYHGIPAPS